MHSLQEREKSVPIFSITCGLFAKERFISSPLFSGDSALFDKNTRGWGAIRLCSIHFPELGRFPFWILAANPVAQRKTSERLNKTHRFVRTVIFKEVA
jgi:hypothetical protein